MAREIYLDNSATTRCFPEVVALMDRIYLEEYGNPSSLHHKGVEAERELTKAKQTLAGILKCEPGQLYFTSCGTESDNQVPAWAEVILAHCTTGYNLGDPRIVWRDSGNHISFEHVAPVSFEVWFSEPKRGRQLGMSILNQGEKTTPIPLDAAYKINVRQTVEVTMVPLSMFGEPDENMAVTFLLSR